MTTSTGLFKETGKKLLVIWAIIFIFFYAMLEFFFLSYAPMVFSRAALDKVAPEASLLVQYSKQGLIPEHYIGILGDSYAYGQGDWLYATQHDRQPIYSASQLLHKKLDRDVISFGLPGSDSIRANNAVPVALLEATRSIARKAIGDPDTIIVYFYEGNDVNDNTEVIEQRIKPLLKSPGDFESTQNFQSGIIPELVSNSDIANLVKKNKSTRRFYFANFVKATAMDFYVRTFVNDKPTPREPIPAGESTQIRMNGSVRYLPDRLQTPALTLTAPEIDVGLYVFEQSLFYLKNTYPSSRIGIAYLPSVITPYEVSSESVNDYYKNKSGNYLQSASRIKKNSEYICHAVQNIAEKLQVGFIDTRARLRATAKNEFVHGPFDWNHFNKKGYETLTEDLLLLLAKIQSSDKQPLPVCHWE